MVDFSGEYRIGCVADEHAVALGLSDKICWKIDGPVSGVQWSNTRDPGRALYDFLRGLDLYYDEHTPVVYAIKAGTDADAVHG